MLGYGIIAIAGFGATPAPAQDMVTLTPEQVATIFCMARTGNDMAPVEGLKSEGLRIAIEEGHLLPQRAGPAR